MIAKTYRADATGERYEILCAKCDGVGRIEAYSHRDNGICYSCEGVAVFGSVSQEEYEKVVARREKAAQRRAEKRAAKQAEKKVKEPKIEVEKIMPPSGRLNVSGTVVSIQAKKSHRFGTTYKMMIQCDNGYSLYGSVPAALADVKKGSTVTMTATIDPQEVGFGFYSRPSKAAIAN